MRDWYKTADAEAAELRERNRAILLDRGFSPAEADRILAAPSPSPTPGSRDDGSPDCPHCAKPRAARSYGLARTCMSRECLKAAHRSAGIRANEVRWAAKK